MVVIMLASLGTLIALGSLLVIALYNPSKLPLELLGLADYTILDPEEFRTPDTQEVPTLTLTAVAIERGRGIETLAEWPAPTHRGVRGGPDPWLLKPGYGGGRKIDGGTRWAYERLLNGLTDIYGEDLPNELADAFFGADAAHDLFGVNPYGYASSRFHEIRWVVRYLLVLRPPEDLARRAEAHARRALSISQPGSDRPLIPTAETAIETILFAPLTPEAVVEMSGVWRGSRQVEP